MRTSQLKQWLKKIFATQEIEISCSDCFNSLSIYVERELAGEAVETMLPMVKQHLDQCQACHEEYEILRELAKKDVD